MSGDAQKRPALRIVSGNATAEEIAVLTALAAVSGGDTAESAPREHRGAWSDPARQVRRPLHPGPNGWRGYY